MINYLARLFADPCGCPDDARYAAMLMVLAYIGLSGYNVVCLAHAFEPQQFGVGAGALAAGVGGWFKLRGPAT